MTSKMDGAFDFMFLVEINSNIRTQKESLEIVL